MQKDYFRGCSLSYPILTLPISMQVPTTALLVSGSAFFARFNLHIVQLLLPSFISSVHHLLYHPPEQSACQKIKIHVVIIDDALPAANDCRIDLLCTHSLFF